MNATLCYYVLKSKVGKNRETVSIETGSRPLFDSESVSKETFMSVDGVKETFSRTNDSLSLSIDTETVSVSVSKETLM